MLLDKKRRSIICILFCLLIINLISAPQPSVLVPTATTGIIIEHPVCDVIKQNTDFKFHFHLYNETSGLPYLNSSKITCIFHLYNTRGSHIIKENKVLSDDIYDWEQLITAGNFTEIGQYAFVFQCNSSDVGGFYEQNFEVTPTGKIFSLVDILVYIFFLMLCLSLTFFSFLLFKNNKFSKDVIKGSEMYAMKKRNEFLYYMTLMKKKLWVVGVFGIYLSLLVFLALLNQLVYNLGLTDLDSILQNVVLIMAWGLIPFTIFWFAWLIIVFYKSTTETLQYQFGAMGRGS